MDDELIQRIKLDPESCFGQRATVEDIMALQTELAVTLPASYRMFLQHFNGGEFRFARMYRITPEGSGFFDLVEMLEVAGECIPAFRDRSLFPFGDDYGGNQFCFDLTQPDANGEYPVVLWDHETSENEGPFPEADSFVAFLTQGLEEE